jgi:ABC-type antimicrobial peptide transport system permease subunit
MTFNHLDFTVDKNLFGYFKVPLAVTFYDVPYVYDPIILKDGVALDKSKLSNYKFFAIDNQTEVSFVINDAGEYKLVPQFSLDISDNQQVQSENGQAIFSGRISDPGAKITISLNNQEVPNAVSSVDQKTGSFSFALNLIPGANLIQANAQSAFGNIDKITKTVQYQSALKQQPTQTSSGISPYNLAAIVLAALAIIMILLIFYLSKRQRRRRR